MKFGPNALLLFPTVTQTFHFRLRYLLCFPTIYLVSSLPLPEGREGVSGAPLRQ